MKVIYSSGIDVEMWSLCTYKVRVITYITEHHFLGFTWHRTHQNNPEILHCFYDGEYSSNRRLSSIRNTEKQKAKLWLANYKQQNIINYEKESN